jgi:hypothetical protein
MSFSKPDEQEVQAQNYYKAQVGAVVSPLIQKISRLVSIIFHPIFLVVYIYLMLASINPFFFGKTSFEAVISDKHDFGVLMLLVFLLVLLPLLALSMMRGLNMISNFSLELRQERIAPYIVLGLSYLIGFMHLNSYTGAPIVVKLFILGATLAIAMAFFINLFAKISIHTVGMGGLVAFILLALLNTSNLNDNDVWVLPAVVAVAGIVGTARRLLGAHQAQELYLGYFVGFFGQFLAANFV